MTRALVVVDVQQDFCEGGSLPVQGGGAVAEAITRYLEDSEGAYEAVVATRDAHEDPGDHFSDSPDFVRSWPRHCVIGTAGFEFHPDFDPLQTDEIFDKGRHTAAYSGFEGAASDGTPLADWLRDRGIGEVDIVGIATDHCVRATALDAESAGFATRVLLHLTAGVSPDTTEAAMRELGSAGIQLVGKPAGLPAD